MKKEAGEEKKNKQKPTHLHEKGNRKHFDT